MSTAFRLAPRSPAWLAAVRVAGVVALCTGLSALITDSLDLANIIMVYLAGVVYVALREGMLASVATVVASIFLFDLIFVPPRWGLNPLNPSHFFTFAVMLLVGLLISRLADRARAQAALAERRALRAQVLSELAEHLVVAATPEAVQAAISGSTRAVFGADCTVAPDGRVNLTSGHRPLSPEDAELLQAFAHQAELALERCALEHRSAQAWVAAEAERLRNTLLSGISHDFRTPLAAIIGAATSLLEQQERLDAGMRRTLATHVLQQARRLHRLVSDLLDLTRMEEGGLRPEPEWCPADDLLAEALASIGERAGTHRVSCEVDADLIVWCDPRLVQQALVNMLENALRYTPAGTAVRIAASLGPPGAWKLVVADAGPGLPAGHEQDVFGKFQRGQAEPAGTGFGLGLAICAAVARLHGGTISARNAGGAVFELQFPQPALEVPE